MLNVLYHKENGVNINTLRFSIQEFQSIGKDEANLLKNDYLVIFFSENQSFSKDLNCNQDKIDDNLFKIVEKIANKKESFYIEKRNEFDKIVEPSLKIQLQNKKNEFDKIVEPSLEIQLQNKKNEFDKIVEPSLEIQLQNKKNELTFIRKNYLNSTDYKIIKAVENNLEIDVNLKTERQKARDEINEIQNATSLQDLTKFE
jgi:hypothetical protein